MPVLLALLLLSPAVALAAGPDVIVAEAGSEHWAERRQVQIGARRPGFVEVTDGLAAGERVITHGNDKAKPGEPVEVIAVDDGTRPLAELPAQKPAADAADRPAAATSE